MNKSLFIILLTSTVIGCTGRQLAVNDQSSLAVFKPANDIEYFKPMDGAPIEFGTAYGNTFKSDHGTFGKFPGKFETPAHIHSFAYHGVVIQGTMTNPMQGQTGKSKEMGQGSYWFVPAGQAHSTACVSDAPCIFYMHQQVPFDFAMAP